MSSLHAQLDEAVRARLELAQAVIAFEPYEATISSVHSKALSDALAEATISVRSRALSDALAAHIAANDPATVIRMCERDLRVLERHKVCKQVGHTSPKCRAEAERDAMLPVVEAAKAAVEEIKTMGGHVHNEWFTDQARALIAAVDALAPTTVAAGGPESNADTPAVGATCTCPWNNGYLPNSLGHHIACPSLTSQHTPDDDCARTGVPMAGHRDTIAPSGLLTRYLAAMAELGDGHTYLSTNCYHAIIDRREELHGECQVNARRYDGSHKTAATCKTCPSGCICDCHGEKPKLAPNGLVKVTWATSITTPDALPQRTCPVCGDLISRSESEPTTTIDHRGHIVVIAYAAAYQPCGHVVRKRVDSEETP